MKNDIFWSEIGSGFIETGGTITKVIFFAVAVLPLFWAVHRNNEHYFRGQCRNKKRQKKDVIAADTIINR